MTRYFMRDTPLCQMEQQMMTPPYFKPRGHGRYYPSFKYSRDDMECPYGVVYDNGMQLSQLYDGKHLPCYHYEADMTAVGISPRQEPENSKNVTWV